MSATPSTDYRNAATTPGSSATDRATPAETGSLCAIHQPNLFPRIATLAKLFAASCWVVLDDVQFVRRDYQHRARLASLGDADCHRWLSIETHLPDGRSTVIRNALLAAPTRSQKRVRRMLADHYRTSPHWPVLHRNLDSVTALFDTTDKTAEVTEASTLLLLRLAGWQGRVVRSSTLPARTGRSERLADLTAATGCRAYLCGTGGMRYIESEPFGRKGISVVPFRTPTAGVWNRARRISSVWALMAHGQAAVRAELGSAAIAAAAAAGHTCSDTPHAARYTAHPPTPQRPRAAGVALPPPPNKRFPGGAP